MKKKRLYQMISGMCTVIGIYLIIQGDLTNGLLLMILGELVDQPKIY